MFHSFMKRGIWLTFITAILLGWLLFGVLYPRLADMTPVKNNVRIAYHNTLQKTTELAADKEALAEGDLLGTITGKDGLEVRYKAEYTDLLHGLSMEDGSLGGIECAYMETINSNADKLGNTLRYSGIYGERRYTLIGEEEFDSEAEALRLSADDASLVIYYRKRGAVGITTDYLALIYKEVG